MIRDDVRVLVLALNAFFEDREHAFAALLGHQRQAHPMNGALLRRVFIEWASRRDLRVPDLERLMAPYGGRDVIRRYIAELRQVGVVALVPDAQDRRMTLIKPTPKLVSFYDTQLLQLKRAMELFLRLGI